MTDVQYTSYIQALYNRNVNGLNAVNQEINTTFTSDYLRTFFSTSSRLNELNDMRITGKHINKIQGQKVLEMQDLNKYVSNRKQVTSQNNRVSDYNTNNLMFFAMFIKYTLVITCIISILGALVLLDKLYPRQCLWISIVLILLFGTLFVINILSNLTRSQYDWNKYRWQMVDFTEKAQMDK